MSGVANVFKKGVGAVSDTVRDIGRDLKTHPLKGLGEVITGGVIAPLAGISAAAGGSRGTGALVDGASPTQAAGAAAATIMSPFMPDQRLPNIAIQDPNALRAQNDAARQTAARQAQMDQMTEAPGRGGTILTDKYTYRT